MICLITFKKGIDMSAEKKSTDSASPAKRITLLSIMIIQLGVVSYTGSGICSKMTANYPAMSFMWLFWLGLEVVFLGVYAIFWQQIIKRFDLSIAYANRAFAIFWSTLWAMLIFREKVTPANTIGVIVIFAGIMLVNQDAK